MGLAAKALRFGRRVLLAELAVMASSAAAGAAVPPGPGQAEVPAAPEPSESVPSESPPSEPGPTEPEPGESVPSESPPSEPGPTEPVPSEPAPSEPAPSERGPSERSATVRLGEDPTGPTDAAKSVDAVRPIEVLVEGSRPMAPAGSEGDQSLKHREMERLPGAFGDGLRAVEVLPGVVPFVSGLPHFSVRGATPSSTGYLLDGIRIPFLYHLGIGPSVVHPGLVHGIEFFAGPYPVQYGRHVGGVIAATTPPPAYRVRAEASIRLFDASALLAVPMADGAADAFASGRYSYTAAVLSLFSPTTSLGYWDYQAGGGYALGAYDRLRLLAFGSYDRLSENVAGVDKELFAVQFHRLQVRLDHTPPREMDPERAKLEPKSRTSITLGSDRSGLGEQGVLRTYGLGIRADADMPVSSWVSVRAGTDMQLDDHGYEPAAGAPVPEVANGADDAAGEGFSFDVSNAFIRGRTHELGAYADVVLRPFEELELVPGLRADLFAEGGIGRVGLDPRGSVRVRPIPWLTTVTAVGVAHQRPTILVAVPGLDPRALGGGLQEVIQLAQAVELELPEELEARVGAFYHYYANLSDLAATCGIDRNVCALGDRAQGRAYGLEVTVRRSLTEEIGGLVSYTLSRAERTIDDRTVLADFDRTHIVHVALGVDLGRGWHVGSRFTAYSGRPYSLVAFDDPEDPVAATLVGRRNALRREPFLRLDARIEKRWHIDETGWVSLVLEGSNLTLSKETVDFDCRVAEVLGGRGGLDCGGQEIGPITLPSLGVSGGI